MILGAKYYDHIELRVVDDSVFLTAVRYSNGSVEMGQAFLNRYFMVNIKVDSNSRVQYE